MLHTVRTQAEHFRHLIPLVQRRYTVFALDLPGMGYSQIVPGASYDEPAMRTAVKRLVTQLDLRDVTLLGESMGAVLALTKSLAVQFAPRGVRTNAICPGPVETPLLMDWLVKDEEAKRIRLARNPTGRFGKPEEIVHVALYLASDESRWTNGANMVIDGGITVTYF